MSVSFVGNTTQYPFSSVVRIEVHFPNQSSGQYEQGSGSMIDAFHVLTAGHMLYNAGLGGWANQVKVYAGQNGNSKPFGIAYATYERTFFAYQTDSSRNPTATRPATATSAWSRSTATSASRPAGWDSATTTTTASSRGRA